MRRLLLVLIPLMLLLVAFNSYKAITIKGRVTDESGNNIGFASVQVKGTTTGATTTTDGKFTLVVPHEKVTIVISAVGFQTQEIKLKGKKEINVVLRSSAQLMQEVVVVGLGVQKKPMSSPLEKQLTGSVSGVNIQVRGQATISGNNNYPLDIFNTEDYDHITENGFRKVSLDPLSTFSIDVDAASYSNVRRFINEGQMPPAGAVRIEEMINYFRYDYPQPVDDKPFSVTTEISDAPWNSQHKLVLIGLQGKNINVSQLPPSNLVFLIDVSGSMQYHNKLPLVKSSLKLLVDQLREEDKVSIVVYAGAAGLVLPPTTGYEKQKIMDAINRLEAGGSTAGGDGIKLAYKVANENFDKNGNNRVILCTDGDFNVGMSSDDDMERLIEKERKSGVFLTVLGYGMGNYKDNKMQKLADKGNGNHAYIDGINEAKKVFVNEFGGTLFTIAKDVKLQVEFNPEKVAGYRLIGYENRMLNKEDFNDDKKDAGELGSGHTVTALYEIIPAGVKSSFLKDVDPLKYQKNKTEPLSKTAHNGEILTVKFRYKKPDGETSSLMERAVKDEHISFANTSDNFRFATAVAEFGMLLRSSEYKGSSSYDHVYRTAKKAKGKDQEGYRNEFISMVQRTELLARKINGAKEDGEAIVQQ